MSSYKERLERIAGDIKTAARHYKDRYEMRDIECVVERDFESGEVRYIRTDNGQVVHRDKMTMGERQRRIEDMLPRQTSVDIDNENSDEQIAVEMAREATSRLMSEERSSM